jgi:hypothetical protein
MTWHVVIARRAAREIEAHYGWLADRSQATANLHFSPSLGCR